MSSIPSIKWSCFNFIPIRIQPNYLPPIPIVTICSLYWNLFNYHGKLHLPSTCCASLQHNLPNTQFHFHLAPKIIALKCTLYNPTSLLNKIVFKSLLPWRDLIIKVQMVKQFGENLVVKLDFEGQMDYKRKTLGQCFFILKGIEFVYLVGCAGKKWCMVKITQLGSLIVFLQRKQTVTIWGGAGTWAIGGGYIWGLPKVFLGLLTQ